MNINKPATPPLAPELIEQFRKIVGDKHAITDAAAQIGQHVGGGGRRDMA